MEQDQEPTVDSNTVKCGYCHLLNCAKRTGSRDLFFASMTNRLNIHVKPLLLSRLADTPIIRRVAKSPAKNKLTDI